MSTVTHSNTAYSDTKNSVWEARISFFLNNTNYQEITVL